MKQQPQQITPADLQAALRQSSQSSPTAELSDAQILKAKLRFMEIAREICPGYELEEQQKPVILDVFNWCMRLPGKYDPQKGLWIWGSIGSGKSTLLQIVNRFCYEVRPDELIGNNTYDLPFCIYIRRAIDITDLYSEKGVTGLREIINFDRLGIDDIGAESRTTGHYGNAANVIGDLLLRRYDMRYRFQTHVTTNLSPRQISEVYDKRVYDRCGEMFNFVYLDGYTHRPEIIPL